MKCAVCSASVSMGHYCCPTCEAKATQTTNGCDPNKNRPYQFPQTNKESVGDVAKQMAQNTTVPASPKPSGLTDDEIMLEAARTLSAQGQRKKAIAFYQESCRRLPDRADVYREMAVLLLSESLSAWLPWDKSRLARAAASAAGQAQHLGDTNGDCWFIVAEAGGMLGIGTSNVPVVLQEALAKYDEQMGRGEAVSAFYLGTVLRLAQIKEASGHWQDAVGLYAIMAGAAELEQSGKVRRGSFTAEQVEHAHADIARINARLNKKEHR